MNRNIVKQTYRHQIIAVFCILTILTGLTWIASGVSSHSAVTVELENALPIREFSSQGAGSLKRYGNLKVSAGEGQKAASSPRVALTADFDGDGIDDLLVAQNDRLVLHRGNINAFAPQTQEAWEAIRDGRFVSPFEQKTRSTSVPAAADFIFSGDFNRDGKLDAAFAARGDNSLYVLEGDGTGNFPNLRRIETAGAITTLASGDVNRADGLTDLIVGTSSADGFGLQIFSGLGDIFAAEPLFYNLPSQAEAIAVGQLNENEFNDIAVGTAGEVLILSGKDSTQPDSESNPEMLRLSLPGGVKSIVIGDLMPDRDNRTELAVLSPDGTIRILARGALDTRPVSVNEHLAEQVREYQAKGYPIPQRILKRLSKTDLRKPLPRPQSDVTTWAEAETITTAAPNLQLSPQTVLTTGRISNSAVEDLIVLDQSMSRVVVMPFQSDDSKIDAQNIHRSFDGKRAMQEFEVDGGAPVAAFALKLNYDNEEDLLVLKDGGESVAIVSAPQATFTVTSAVDAVDNNLNDNVCNTASNGCTLRAAIMQANHTAGNDTIMINAGINPTISLGQPDNDGQGTNDEATGDLDITCNTNASGDCILPLASNTNNLVIMGAPGGNTVSAGTFTPYPVDGGGSINTDRVFDVGQDGTFGGGFGGSTGVSATFTNLTIQNGNVREALNTNLGGGNRAFGGGIRYDGFRIGGGHGSLTVMNSTVTNNQADNAGGGINAVTGSFTASGATFSNNITKAGEGGGLFFGAATSASNVNISASTFNANEARQGVVFGTFTANADGGGARINANPNTVTIGTTNFTNNIAQEDGGAIKTLDAFVTVTGGTMTGNTARRHGGVAFGDNDTPGNGAFFTFSGTTMKGNTANSDNAGTGLDAGAGGAVFRDRGTLNLTSCIIGGTVAGEPNTAVDGGGVAHFFTVDSAAGNTSNQTTVNINGGSIVGNNATGTGTSVNNNGGGVYFNASLFDVTASTLNIGQTTATAITGNKAKNNGGGVYVSGAATANLKNMTLLSNQANSDNSGGGDGGGLYQDTTGSTTNFTGTLTIGGSGTANSAVNGGGIRNNAGTVNIPSGASITFNTATGTGGGISNAGTLSNLTSPTISSNSAANGGGISQSGSAFTISGATINSNAATGNGGGVYITANEIDITGSTISGNTKEGIFVTGGTGSTFNTSNIFNNSNGLGIDLGTVGVTPNDANDADGGANNLQNFPVLNYVKSTGEANVTFNSTPSRNFRIEYFANTTCDASGNGEGETYLTSQNVTTPAGGTVTFNSVALSFGAKLQITATATDLTTGDTSEFSACRKVNTPPTISASAVSRQQGSASSNSQIATVADPDQPLNTLSVTVNGGASATNNGVTVSNIAVSAAGVVTADVVAACNATNASFTLRVTDNATEFNEATLNVTVTTNTAPTVGNYPNPPTINAGTSGTVVTPSAAPADNGSVASVTAAAPGFTGTFIGNTTTGAITINNAAPAGTYTVTVTVTDNCMLTTTKTFTLTVNAIPTITAAAGVTRLRGDVTPTNSQIATVNDAEQAANTLSVTINGGATATVNMVTVSNIAVNAMGVVTANIAADCGATTATFTLRVTDSNGAFSEAMLTVTVNPNTNPTAGTYANTMIGTTDSTTVTPSAAPTDNGTFTASVSSGAGFSGTLAVDQTTGVVTITNANPAGMYTITVTFTDNCGAVTT